MQLLEDVHPRVLSVVAGVELGAEVGGKKELK